MKIRIRGGVDEVDNIRAGWYYRTRASLKEGFVAMYIGDKPEDIIRWLEGGTRLNGSIGYWIRSRCSIDDILYRVLEHDMKITSSNLRA